MSVFTACIVQTTPNPFDKDGNLRRALDAMTTASEKGASLILFPEMFLTGYLVKKRLPELIEPMDGPYLAALKAKAKELSMGVIMGMPIANPKSEKPFNSIVMIDRDGSVKAVANKTHCFGGEEKMFTPGTELKAFDTSFGRMGILVCYDGEFPETARTLALDGAKILCMCSANMTPYEDYHPVYMRARAMENCVYTLYVNYVGEEKRFHYCGQSSAFHPTGRILAQTNNTEEAMLYVPVDTADTTSPDTFMNYLNYRRPELYHASLR